MSCEGTCGITTHAARLVLRCRRTQQHDLGVDAEGSANATPMGMILSQWLLPTAGSTASACPLPCHLRDIAPDLPIHVDATFWELLGQLPRSLFGMDKKVLRVEKNILHTQNKWCTGQVLASATGDTNVLLASLHNATVAVQQLHLTTTSGNIRGCKGWNQQAQRTNQLESTHLSVSLLQHQRMQLWIMLGQRH